MVSKWKPRKRTLLDRLLRRPPPRDPMMFFGQSMADRRADQERHDAEQHRIAEERQIQQLKEAALRRAERPKPAPLPPIAQHAVTEAMAPQTTPTGRAFDKAAQTSERITQQTFDARFRSEPARANALDAMDEAKKRRELNDQVFDDARREQKQMIRDLNGRAWSDEGGRAINEFLERAWEAHEQEKRTIDFDLKMMLDEAERLNPPGKGFKKPLRLTGPEPDSMEPFNQASTGTPNWRSIFFTAVQKGVTIEVAQAELEPAVEPSMGQDGTPPEGGWLAHFNEVARHQPSTEPGLGIDL